MSVCHYHWCVRVAVCPASKCYDMIIHFTLCVCLSFSLVCPCGSVSCFKMLWYNYLYYSVCPCGSVSCLKWLWYNYSYYSLCHYHWCVRVAVCPASKCYDIIICISLCVCVAVFHASNGYGIIILCVHVSFSLVCPCGGVSCFKRLWYNYSYFVCHFHWCVHVSVCHVSNGHGRNILLICVSLCPCVILQKDMVGTFFSLCVFHLA